MTGAEGIVATVGTVATETALASGAGAAAVWTKLGSRGVGRGVYAGGGASRTAEGTSGLATVNLLRDKEVVESLCCDDRLPEGPGGVRGGGEELALEPELDEERGRGM